MCSMCAKKNSKSLSTRQLFDIQIFLMISVLTYGVKKIYTYPFIEYIEYLKHTYSIQRIGITFLYSTTKHLA